MGTSKSSTGSPSSVPMVPPWVPDPEAAPPDDANEQQDQQSDEQDSEESQPDQEAVPTPIAPRGRFGQTRRSLGDFGSSGNHDSLRRGVGRYVGSGLGGSRTATRRFGGTASTAGALYGALGGSGTGATSEHAKLDRALLEGRSARQVINVIIDTVCPVDGTQDTEASRYSINDALSELMKRYPDADLLELTENQREFVVESYVSMDVYRRFVLDVGNAIREKAPNASTALSRFKQAREYIHEHIIASFHRLRDSGKRLSGSRVSRIVSQALKDAFDIFAGYVK